MIVRFAVATLPAASVALTVIFALTFSPLSSAWRTCLRCFSFRSSGPVPLTVSPGSMSMGPIRVELVHLDVRQLPPGAYGARLVATATWTSTSQAIGRRQAGAPGPGVLGVLLLRPRELEVRRGAIDGLPRS